MNERIFTLFACCIPVKGARRSTVCDLERGTFHFIPNGLYDILTENKGQRPSRIKAVYGHLYDEEIDEYFLFLIEKELGFWCDDPSLFPGLDLTYERPESISNAIIDSNESSTHDFRIIAEQLDELGCKALQLRFFSLCDFGQLQEMMEAFKVSKLRSIELITKYNPAITEELYDELAIKYQRITSIIVHSSPEHYQREALVIKTPICFVKKTIDSSVHCGEIHPGYFVSNPATFTEAQKFNTCLNRKISIDVDGEIKNCPSLTRSFGNMKHTSLPSALLRENFKDLWEINKDQVDICKDCEFRYICTDCRAFIKYPDDIYSKPSKCRYDPYAASWEA